MEDITNYLNSVRRDYSGKQLDAASVNPDPFKQFEQWFEEAVGAQVLDPNAMTLATASSSGKPSARIVLLRGIDSGGFNFYTNYDSKKGTDIIQNPSVALTFFWVELNRQVRVEGNVEKLSLENSKAYFASRPRESQIAAWASEQSEQIQNREELEERFKEYEKKFEGAEVPCPENWGGFSVKPTMIEFWQGRPNRMHDRIVYTLDENGSWPIKRLAP